MHAMMRHEIPGWFPECQGGDQEQTFQPHQVPYDYYSMGVGCGQCQVIIQEPFYSQLNKKPSTEVNTMERMSELYAENSRLACCVQVRKEHNEMIAIVGDNRSGESEWFGGRDFTQ